MLLSHQVAFKLRRRLEGVESFNSASLSRPCRRFIDPIVDNIAIGREVRGVDFRKAASGKMLAYVHESELGILFKQIHFALGE